MITAPRRIVRPSRSRTPVTPAILDRHRRHLGLHDTQIRLGLQHLAHANAVLLLVALRARRPHRRPAAGVQKPELNADRIGHFAHHAAERIDLANQVPLGDSPHRRIAGHLRNQVQIHGDHGRAQPHARTGARRLAAGMPGTHHHHVVPRLTTGIMVTQTQ